MTVMKFQKSAPRPIGDILTKFTIVCFILICGVGAAHAQEARTSTSAGVFTEEQAKKGAVAYNAKCAVCHGTDLLSTDREVPNLAGSLKFSWVGKTVGEMFQTVRDTMPPEEKHSLDDQVYLDIVTYILRFHKVPTGNQPLKPDIQVLKQIVIAPPD
jgi:cytochrome c553